MEMEMEMELWSCSEMHFGTAHAQRAFSHF